MCLCVLVAIESGSATTSNLILDILYILILYSYFLFVLFVTGMVVVSSEQ